MRMLKRKVKTQGRQTSVAVRKLLRNLNAKTPDGPQWDNDLQLAEKVQEFKARIGRLPEESRDPKRHEEAQLASNFRKLKKRVRAKGRQVSVAVRKMLRDLDAKTE